MSSTNKRLFFGLKATSTWPLEFPRGRLLHPNERHATLVYLGNMDWDKLSIQLSELPQPVFDSGLGGIFDEMLFLPYRHPHAVSLHVNFYESQAKIVNYRNELANRLKEKKILTSAKEDTWLPHVTLARKPFDKNAWKVSFSPTPVIFESLNLYESIGNLRYHSLWCLPLPRPFEEVEHAAHLGFIIKGETLSQLYLHALLAVSFKFPEILKYRRVSSRFTTSDDMILALNEVIASGCPFKKISLPRKIEKYPTYLRCEMVVSKF